MMDNLDRLGRLHRGGMGILVLPSVVFTLVVGSSIGNEGRQAAGLSTRVQRVGLWGRVGSGCGRVPVAGHLSRLYPSLVLSKHTQC